MKLSFEFNLTGSQTIQAQKAETMLNEWNCHIDGKAFFTHGALLVPVAECNEKMMLKIIRPEYDEVGSERILNFYDGCSAVRIIKSDDNAQLQERIISSGPTLEEMVLGGQDDEATRVICQVLGNLHSLTPTAIDPEDLHPFSYRTETIDHIIARNKVHNDHKRIFETASRIQQEYIAETAHMNQPLHGDAQHYNILRSDERGWLAIDPKGIWGPRPFDYACCLFNPFLKKPEIVLKPERLDRQVSIISEESGFEKSLIATSNFICSMQAASRVYGNDVPFQSRLDFFIQCARNAASLANIRIEPV